ncbi:MAG: hypothetical protein NTW21_09560 [Verrucomicrobia bacterium]|nr:hypothetical protein [Verrucomicrobiota bacterium]
MENRLPACEGKRASSLFLQRRAETARRLNRTDSSQDGSSQIPVAVPENRFDLCRLPFQASGMAQLLVRNLENELVRHLRKRADEHGVSVEEEHRRILREALHANGAEKRKSFWQVLSEMPDGGDDSLFERERGLPGRGTAQPLFGD